MVFALFAQTGSRWTFQANKMNCDLGFYIVKPDQIQVLGALLPLLLIPIFETVIYPVLRRLGIQRPLQKMTISGIVLALSFVVAGILQFKIEATLPNAVHVLWQLPQYVIASIADVMFSSSN